MDRVTENSEELKIVDSLDYRGFHVDFYDDDPGQQVYTNWEGRTVGFGAFNLQYKEDMKCLIDEKLDLITRFPELENIHGAKLSWFYNGNGYQDIGLYYRSRLIRVFLVKDKELALDEHQMSIIINISKKILLELFAEKQ